MSAASVGRLRRQLAKRITPLDLAHHPFQPLPSLFHGLIITLLRGVSNGNPLIGRSCELVKLLRGSS
jgi:hypothetical protein